MSAATVTPRHRHGAPGSGVSYDSGAGSKDRRDDSHKYFITVDTGGGFDRVASAFGRMPASADRAMKRAVKKLSIWLKRQVLRAVSESSKLPQKAFTTGGSHRKSRYHVQIATDQSSVNAWVGTSAIHATYMGKPVWQRSWTGAHAGKRRFPGTWSWAAKSGAKTGEKIMIRTGHKNSYTDQQGYSKEGITHPLYDIVHGPVLGSLSRLAPEANQRFERILDQELNYALNIEAAR